MKTKMDKFVSILIMLILLVSIVVIANADNANDVANKNVVYKRVIAENIGKEDIQQLQSKGCTIKHTLKRAASFECPQELISQLDVREARIFYLVDFNADKQIGADKVWSEGVDGTGVKVAVLDSGIDTDHPELQDSYLGGYDYVNNDNLPEDDNGHGTHVAGIITANGNTANAKGVAPGAGIYMYKVCDANGACYEDDMMAAMEAAVQTDAEVMSISIGGGSYTTENCDSDQLAAKVNWVVNQGLAVVVAAGNDGRGVSVPGCASGAIAVGAVDSSNNVPYFSGRGKALDIVAPGVNIYSTVINSYGTMSGTSMATPHVSGVVALLLDTNPGLATSDIKNALYTTTNPVNTCYRCTFWWGTSCFSQQTVTCTAEITGAGVVDAYEAYTKVKPTQTCSSDAECDDGTYCNGAETCMSGVCKAGTAVDCSSLNNQCNTGVCDEAQDTCVAQPKANGTTCDDGLYCNTGETCQSGTCTGGSARSCDDGKSCTTDTCNEASDVCENVWPGCGLTSDGCCGPSCSSANDADCSAAVKCWSGSNKYLYRNTNQARKFCKCATGTYGYSSYSYSRLFTTVYRYTDSGNNENWATTSTSSYGPIYAVKCPNGSTYNTNKDYYR